MSTLDDKILSAWTSLESLAKDRFTSYQRPGDQDSLDALARYVWSVETAKSLHPKLNALEVTFRNQVHNRLQQIHGETWFDDASLLSAIELQKVAAAKKSLVNMRKPQSTGRLVAELSFGFWTSLYGRHHEQDIVRPTIRQVFPFRNSYQDLSRGLIASRLRSARFLRNRISHLEPVAFDVKLPQVYEEMCELIQWMSPEMTLVSDVGDNFLEVYGEGWQKFRPTLAANLG